MTSELFKAGRKWNKHLQASVDALSWQEAAYFPLSALAAIGVCLLGEQCLIELSTVVDAAEEGLFFRLHKIRCADPHRKLLVLDALAVQALELDERPQFQYINVVNDYQVFKSWRKIIKKCSEQVWYWKNRIPLESLLFRRFFSLSASEKLLS